MAGNWAEVPRKPKQASKPKRGASKPRKAGEWSGGDWESVGRVSTLGAGGGSRPLRTGRRSTGLTHAARMVQTFVDALAGSAEGFTVGIDAHAQTASTDFNAKSVKLPASVILDPTIDEDDAAALMVGFVAHEIGHIRHDSNLYAALKNDSGAGFLHQSAANLLRESRVERGFTEAFPGFGDLFGPMLRFVSREVPDGSTPPMADLERFALAATRYPFRFDWSNPVAADERDWWQSWVARYASAEDYVTHRAGLDAAVERWANPPTQTAAAQAAAEAAAERAASGPKRATCRCGP